MPAFATSLNRRRLSAWLCAAALGLGASAQAVDLASVPASKRTQAGLYLGSGEVSDFIRQHGGAERVLFIDVRTGAEALFVGMPTTVDALVPLFEVKTGMADWDAQQARFKFEPVEDFVPLVRQRLEQKGLKPSDTVILICRSGERSARAADRLSKAGFSQVWSVVDGFEGDMGPEGRRSVNGWKNTGQAWSYKLDPARMPPAAR